MLELHHKEIVDFFRLARDSTPALSFIPPESESYRLLNCIIEHGYNVQRQNKIAFELALPKSNLCRIQSDLNRMLQTFCSKYEITPAIQLYFSSRGKYPGGHFACCDVSINSNKSEHYICSDLLHIQLEKAKEKLGIPSSSPSNEMHSEKNAKLEKIVIPKGDQIKVTVTIEDQYNKTTSDVLTTTDNQIELSAQNATILSKPIELYSIKDYHNIDTVITLFKQKQYCEAKEILQSLPPHEPHIIFLKQLSLLLSRPISKLHNQEAKNVSTSLVNISDTNLKDAVIHILNIMQEIYYRPLGRKLPCQIPSSETYESSKESEQLKFISSLFGLN